MRHTVLLFDIDGTLVATGGVGKRAMVAAFDRLHGVRDIFEGTNFAGMTDRAIVRHGLERAAVEATGDAIELLLEHYLECLHVELQEVTRYRVLPGVTSLLRKLHGRERIAIGLGTGNVKRGAYAKLAPGKIDGAFAFGGFGCDHEDRVELIRTGAERGAAALGVARSECRVVIIGDTPKDVAAAKGIGAECVAVATGGFTSAQLRETNAEHVIESLEDERVVPLLVG